MMANNSSSNSPNPTQKQRTKALMRFFSVDSNINMSASNVETQPIETEHSISRITYDFYSKDFLFKITELVRWF